MKTLIPIILILALVWQSIMLVRERDLRRQADEVIEAHEAYEVLQDGYASDLERRLETYHCDVTVTAYSGHHEPDAENTAIMEKPRPGIVAVSRDLFAQGWTFGRKVYISGVGVYIVGDLMAERWTERIDIFIDDTTQAREFGIKQVRACLIVG